VAQQSISSSDDDNDSDGYMFQRQNQYMKGMTVTKQVKAMIDEDNYDEDIHDCR
jgi:hypothetical protein